MADQPNNFANGADLALVKHDIRNQLSNIALCISQLKFELPDVNDDIKFYLETINTGCTKINELLIKTD